MLKNSCINGLRSVRWLLVVVAAMLSTSAAALSGKEHTADMVRVFPFTKAAENERVLAFYGLVNAYLDYPGQDPTLPYDRHAPKRPRTIAEHPKFGRIQWLGKHRIWFHWGFNTDPRQFAPITRSLDAAVRQGVITREDLPEFWELMNGEVSRRNRALMNEAAEVFGYGRLGTISTQQRRQLNALVTVLYSVHVVGDHLTPDSAIVAPLGMVYADIGRAIDNLAGKDAANQAGAKTLKAALKKAQGSPREYLDALARGFTPFLLSLRGPGYDYRDRFARQGYVMRGC